MAVVLLTERLATEMTAAAEAEQVETTRKAARQAEAVRKATMEATKAAVRLAELAEAERLRLVQIQAVHQEAKAETARRIPFQAHR